MKATEKLHELGQSLWLDNITRELAEAGIDVDALAAKLQADAATSFVESWNDLLAIIDTQSAALTA